MKEFLKKHIEWDMNRDRLEVYGFDDECHENIYKSPYGCPNLDKPLEFFNEADWYNYKEIEALEKRVIELEKENQTFKDRLDALEFTIQQIQSQK
jgi:hypothetical protein